MEQYVHSLLCEARLRATEINSEAFTTLYLGGGTPSVLPLNLLTTLITGLDNIFDLSHVEEITIENDAQELN